MKIRFQFLCPDCGGSQYGSIEQQGKMRRHCSRHNCGFTWYSEDDYKTFAFINRAETPEEYREMLGIVVKRANEQTDKKTG